MTPDIREGASVDGDDLILVRRFAASPDRLWRAWTTPADIVRWFAPRPVRVPRATVDPWPGGVYRVAMILPDGTEMDEPGCVLVAEPGRRLAFTDALSTGLRPTGGGFMTADIRWEPDGDGAVQTVRVLHKDAADRQRHWDMGFDSGWNAAADQLAEMLAQG